MAIPFAATAVAQVAEPCVVDVSVETAQNPTGTQHTLTAEVSNRTPGTCAAVSNAQLNGVQIDFEVVATTGTGSYSFVPTGGASSPGIDAGDTKTTPDMTCTTGAGGEADAKCRVSYIRNDAGNDTITAWHDRDLNNTTTEADTAEGRNEATTPGNISEPDGTDVVEKQWQGAAPANQVVDCDDADDAATTAGQSSTEQQTNPHLGAGSEEVYTCRVVNNNGTAANEADDTPVSGVKIDAEVLSDINDPGDDASAAGTADRNDACTTGADGSCTVTIASEGQQGTTLICFWADFDSDNSFDTADTTGQDGGDCDSEAFGEAERNDITDTVQKTWVARAATTLSLTPQADNNLVNTSHTVTATVLDQFGDPVANVNVDIRVTGRNTRTQNDLLTNAAGQASFTYTDTGAAATTGGDNIAAHADIQTEDDVDNGGAEPDDTAVKQWVLTLPTVAVVELDMQMDDILPPQLGGADDSDCPEGAFDANATAANAAGTTHEICAEARNSAGATIVGAEFTFQITSGPGFFTNQQGANLGTTITVGSDQAGDGHAAIRSTTAGTTTVQVTSGGQTDSGTKTWTGLAAGARTLDCEPETAENESGTTHLVTCTALDRNGNAVTENVDVRETGAGRISSTSSCGPTAGYTHCFVTDANGQIEVVLTTTQTEEGTQTLLGALQDDADDTTPLTREATEEQDECDRLAGDPAGAPAGVCADEVSKTWGEAPPPPVTECSDGIDNDGDGDIDLADRGCTSPQDDSEAGEEEDVATNLTIRYQKKTGDFKGAVGSSRKRCQTGRLIVLKKVTPGPNRTVGTDRSNRFGNWRIHKPRARGRFYAIARPKTFTDGTGTIVHCLRDRSVTIKVGRR